jgi:CO/xanthine dehydrogenase FAD-binding subunit
MTTYSQLCGAGTPVGQELALLTEVAAGITGGPQIRNRGTVGGSASYANPSSDVPACLAVLGARLRLLSPSGTRVVPVADYFVGPFRTVRREDEVLVAIELPADGIRRTGYLKLKHSQSSWPIVTAAAVELGDGAWRVAIGGAADVPVSIEVDSPDAGTDDRAWRQHVRDAAGSGIQAAGGPWSDVLADGEYRLRVAPVVVARAMARAVGGHIPGGA